MVIIQHTTCRCDSEGQLVSSGELRLPERVRMEAGDLSHHCERTPDYVYECHV